MVLDVRSRAFSFPSPPRRVVSLIPSLTETLFALGAGEDVVAVTEYCIFPENLDRPRIGGTKNPQVERIRALAPDLVHMNLEENMERHAYAIEQFAPVFVSEPKSVDDVESLLVTLGEIHHRDPGPLLAALREARLMTKRPFTFACPIWKNPWMWCGDDTYVSNLVESAGGRNVLAGRTRYPEIALEDVLAMKPEIVFLPDEPYAFTEEDAAKIRDTRVIGPFPGHLFTWHGTRTIEGLKFLWSVV